MKVGIVTLWVSMMIMTSTSHASEHEKARDIVSRGMACVDISARLDRLACFDDVFKTPAKAEQEMTLIEQKPDAWKRAMQSESQRSNEVFDFQLFYVDETRPENGIWMTATAMTDRVQKKSEMPVLMFSCIENISRVELMLPRPTNAGKASVTASSNTSITQRWLSDDTGNIMRAGRGLPAIDIMKALMSGDRAVLRSELPEIGNLTFDTATLRDAIKPMRNTCRW